MSRSPNTEQLKAIEACNGAILSAGAGSGKTFVIVEHLIYLLEKKAKEFLSEEHKQEKIPQYLDRIVLMTFTKKASGEMLVRLIKRVEEKYSEDNQLWGIVLKNISRIRISTIHGFCHSLISEGYWPSYPGSFELLNSTLHFNKIKKIFDQWFENSKAQLPEQMLAHTSDLLNGLFEIFESPELRLMWREIKSAENPRDYLDDFFANFLELKNLQTLFNNKFELSYTNEQLKKQGFKLLSDFTLLKDENGLISSINFLKYIEFFEQISRFPSATKDMSEIDRQYRLGIKALFDCIKKHKLDLISFQKNFTKFKVWEKELQSAFNFVNGNYLNEPGLTFSDLEYYVSVGLRDEEVRKKVSSKYEVFIVDEFQDTSPIQFEIIHNCLNGNLNKLFCVGDKKQAIYGFRGGELKVFEECSDRLGKDKQLSLKSNYRSEFKIIDFNNKFFEHILPIGPEYEDLDPHSVEMENQNYPFDTNEGSIQRFDLITAIEDDELNIDQVEAHGILEAIKLNLEDKNIDTIAVLYKKLAPSKILIDLLKKEEIDFTAQVKILIDDDPIFTIFHSLVIFELNESNLQKREATKNSLKAFLKIFSINEEIDDLLLRFTTNLNTLGLETSFIKFLYELNISNSLYQENINLILSLIQVCEGSLLQLNQLIDKQDSNYSIEMMNGNSKKVHLLTVHTSKGLEYDCVILGGIHKNGKYEGLKDKVGKLPNSFKWKADFNQKDFFKSPAYLIESYLLTQKDFSESKRLLYVACTRAVKKLIFMNVINSGKEKSFFGNSWINAFRSFNFEELEVHSLPIEIDKHEHFNLDMQFKDQLGILNTNHTSGLGVVSELSVTRLAMIVDCPFKFYLKNICKLETKNFSFENTEEDEREFKSSMQRGTKIHANISRCLIDENHMRGGSSDDEKINWVLDQIKIRSAQFVISEKEMKFSFMGHMITAIPDLILKDKTKIEIWDFKTGLIEEGKENSYWFQLMVYAYGVSIIESLSQDFVFDLKLVYLDERKIKLKTLELKEILKLIKTEWKKIDNFNQPNLNHCTHCEFNKICKHNSST